MYVRSNDQQSPSGPDSDLAVVAGLRERRPDAINAAVERYSPIVEMIAGSVLSDPLDVEEVVQDAFMKAFGAIDSFDPRRASFSTWLGRIAYNTALNAARSLARHPLTSLDDMPVEPPEPEPPEADPDTALLVMALETLDPPDRALLQLVYYAEMPLSEAAEILDSTAQALAARLYRLRRRLASSIQSLRKNSQP